MIILSNTNIFLKNLKENNNKDWFSSNKESYIKAKENFHQYVTYLIKELEKSDATIQNIQAKDCIFRIYRDMRFSKDKKPYKENMGAFISFEGRKTKHAGYYFHIEHNACMVAGGVYMPQADVLKKIRKFINTHSTEFISIIHNKQFKKYFEGLYMNPSLLLKKLPKGFENVHEEIEPYLKLKSFTVHSNLKNFVNNSKISIETLKRFIAMQGLIHFFNKALIA